MLRCLLFWTRGISLLFILFLGCSAGAGAEPALRLQKGDRISFIGNTLADRMQHSAWLETYIYALHPELDLTFRNLGYSGDELKVRPREENFGSADQWLAKTKASVVFCFFGYNEALRGPAGLDGFRKDLSETIDGMLKQKYDGENPPRLVFFSPIAHENLKSPHLPDGSANNEKLSLYAGAMKEVCDSKKVLFVDLYAPTRKLYAAAEKPLTMNGIHLLEHGDRAVANAIVKELFGVDKISKDEKELERLRQAILEKNYYWFSRYRVVDGYNVFGGRSKLAWFGQSNADVMMREMEIFDVMTANRDQRVRAVARGGDQTVSDNNIPAQLTVKTNIPGPLPGGKHKYLGGKEAITKMKIAEGMQVNLFASEEMFPDFIKPVQMAVDCNGRLFASCWPSYPHWNPTEPRKDKIVCLIDDNGDGVADRCVTFADELNSVTGFTFWGGGMLVAALPEIWFLKDTNGDGKADVKIRMLQGLSSADTHHSANAMLIGPDGWLYWSRGIFNVATMETPTKTFRSGESGVHRFNPRTFEMEFHFPIGPNPHGDVFDQWGFQFANDGTGGVGCYVNIGKGVGAKPWFKMRVRPVAATGLISGTHFPEKNQGNFLVCNTIGFQGVLQHEVKYNGAEITATEIEPILVSSDPNFRPSDVKIGGDGALYVADWNNAIIGHMQHNMRDPNRDHEHGRVYRVTAKDRPLAKHPLLIGKPIPEVCQAFYTKDNNVRCHARIELSGRETSEVVAKVTDWSKNLDPSKPDDAQALLECLWVFEEHRVPNLDLLKRVFNAEEPRVRAAAIRTLGHWGMKVSNWEPTLLAAARDASALVRAEAVKSAVSFEGVTSAEVIFEVADRPTDPELNTVLGFARGKIPVDKLVQEAVSANKPLSKAALAYAYRNASVDDLLKLPRTESIYEAILNRPNASPNAFRESLKGLAELRKSNSLALLVSLLEERDANNQSDAAAGLAQVLLEHAPDELKKIRGKIEKLSAQAKTAKMRQLGYAAWIVADGSGDAAFLAASKNKESLRELLAAIPSIPNEKLREGLFNAVRALMFDLPPNLKSEGGAGALQNGINVEFFQPNPSNVSLETLAKLKPKASGVATEISLRVPQRKADDAFALKFTGMLSVPKSGKYTFYISSDDGSRFYLDDKPLIDNDGGHGMQEKSGTAELTEGLHPFVVTYYDGGGGDGLEVAWSGPGLNKQPIGVDRLFASGGETLHDVAVRSLSAIPGHEAEKFLDLVSLMKADRSRPAAIHALRAIPEQHWAAKELPGLADNLVGYLSGIPARLRTAETATDAIALAKALSSKLPADQGKAILDRLQNLNVRVIAIGTIYERMIFDKEMIAVQAGKPVEFRFSNTDSMPHNFAIVQPGSLEEIGLLSEATARDADAKERHFVPKSAKVLLSSRLLEAGQNQAISYDVPQSPGVYPYVCTYPGHWRRMFGALFVVANLEDYQANPEGYLARNPLPLKDDLLKTVGRNTEWKYDDLIGDLKKMPPGRSFEVGKSLFKAANCVGCHKVNNEGRELGPDLTKIDPAKHNVEHILLSIIEPSKEIAEKYQSNSFLLDSGKVVTGMVVEETATEIKVLVDPLAQGEPAVLLKSEIEKRTKSTASIMPQGVLSKLSREEIIDLVAYILARGDKSNAMYAGK